MVQDERISMMWPYTDEENDFISFGKLPEVQQDDKSEADSDPAEASK